MCNVLNCWCVFVTFSVTILIDNIASGKHFHVQCNAAQFRDDPRSSLRICKFSGQVCKRTSRPGESSVLWNVNVLKLQTASSMAGCLGPGNMQYREVVHLVWSVEYDNWLLSCPVNPKKHFEKVLIVNLWRTAGVSENLMLVNPNHSFS